MINGLSRPNTSMCVGVDSQVRVIHSTGGRWSAAAKIDAAIPLTAVSCADNGLCVAVGGHGHAVVSTRPIVGAAARHGKRGIDRDLTSIACPIAGLCVAVDARGDEITAAADRSANAS